MRRPNEPKGVCVVGAQPPPVHGMAVVNAHVTEQLIRSSSQIQVIDLAPRSLSRKRANRVGRIAKVIKGLVTVIIKKRSWETMYLSVSGGYGQIYEILFVLVARCLGGRVFLHHHSFAYLDKHSSVTKVLTAIAGKSATHIVLCEKMGNALSQLYPSVKMVRVLSNISLIRSDESQPEIRSNLKTIGYLSNISKQKGVFEFLDVLGSLNSQGITVEGQIAGPFEDQITESEVMKRLSELPNVTYVGPKYAADKKRFLDGIDILLFPTSYFNEAEPLTIYEAMAEGIPVIAWEKGCISEALPKECGLVVSREQSFVEEAMNQIRYWIGDSKSFSGVSRANLSHFKACKAKLDDQYDQLIRLMLTHS